MQSLVHLWKTRTENAFRMGKADEEYISIKWKVLSSLHKRRATTFDEIDAEIIHILWCYLQDNH